MRLYHFLNQEYGLQAIETQRIKVSRISSLNDPFEYFYIGTENYVVRFVLKERKKRADRTFGLICFSGNCTSPVQWAHYADSHKGLCLAFDVESPDLMEVEYVPARASLDEFKDALDVPMAQFLRRMLSKKYEHWAYEQEVRLLLPIPEKTTDLVFEEFGVRLKLREIYIGARSRLTAKGVAKIVRRVYGELPVYKVRPSLAGFAMCAASDA